MKTILATLAICAVLIGCTTSQQSTAFKTLASAEATVNLANDSYQTLVIKGAIPTNTVPQVSKLYNDFQASELLALDAVQFNTNALSPTALVVEGQDFVNLINSIKLKSK
jgi:hypothetical protein